MTHQQVIGNFIREGKGGSGTFVKATEDMLYSKIPHTYRPYGWHHWQDVAGREAPLAVRLADGDLLVNGTRLPAPMSYHQDEVLREVPETGQRFGVVPFHGG